MGPTTAAYTDQYNNYAWQEFTEFAMADAVDADNDWAAYKLVGTMADESKRIVFFTDPTATTGQLQVLGFTIMTSVSSGRSTLAFGHGIQRVTMAAARPTERF